MAPPAKKPKLDHATDIEAPVVFHCAGHQPDTRIMVFGQEYHAHSVLLKMNSAFFRKFMDSPDKELSDKAALLSAAGTSLILRSSFRYEWVTKVDEGGEGWSLVADHVKNQPYSLEIFQGDTDNEVETFEKLLCAIHLEAYILDNTSQLEKLADFADYYAALPIISKTLDSAIINSHEFCEQIWEHRGPLFIISAKLRNALLFRECLIYLTSPFQCPDYKRLNDPKLRKVVKHAYDEIAAKVVDVAAAAIELGAADFAKDTPWTLRHDKVLFSRISSGAPNKLSYPTWFRGLLKSKFGDQPDLHTKLANILSNKLLLNKEGWAAGDRWCPNDFMCATIDDEDLP